MSNPDASTYSALAGRHILVTGGTGYIGSHTVLALLQTGARVTIIDNLSNSSLVVLDRLDEIVMNQPGIAQHIGTPQAKPVFHKVDLRNLSELEAVFVTSKFDACIHFAGLKAVGESVAQPLSYYEHNVVGTLNLLRMLEKYHCRRLVFSSSATVYGLAEVNPIAETAPLSTTNPYGQTKLVIEGMLRDVSNASVGSEAATEAWSIVMLRYFNPIGADVSGRIGEDPAGIPNNLLPFVMQVAVGRRERVNVFGGDWPTPDGTGVRDYIHVSDLAAGHLAALQEGIFGTALSGQGLRCDAFNLGTGAGISVLQMIAAAQTASGQPIPYQIVSRRTGDIATCYADASKARKLLKWSTTRTLQQAIQDAWRWQNNNPHGFTNTVPLAAAAVSDKTSS
jgi:UDP-glucose 4-epimerase